MIDLSVVETFIQELDEFSEVSGVTKLKRYISNGFSGVSCALVAPLTSKSTKSSGGTMTEYENLQRFAVVVGLSDGGAATGGDNKELARLVMSVAKRLLGNTLSEETGVVDLGSGFLLPTGDDSGCVFWQQEFLVKQFVRI